MVGTHASSVQRLCIKPIQNFRFAKTRFARPTSFGFIIGGMDFAGTDEYILQIGIDMQILQHISQVTQTIIISKQRARTQPFGNWLYETSEAVGLVYQNGPMRTEGGDTILNLMPQYTRTTRFDPPLVVRIR